MAKLEFLTVGTLRVIAKEFPYIRLRQPDGSTRAFNSKIMSIGENRFLPDSYITPYISYHNISFMEYIRTKAQLIQYQ